MRREVRGPRNLAGNPMITTTSSPDRSLAQLLAACVAAAVPVVLSPDGPLLLGAVIVATVITGAVVSAAVIGGSRSSGQQE
jgi:VIT1/CCC1 family predicted Fe2+/Mn2+ transporter